jgi:DNA-binding LytR/AlgR family response regulator
MGSRGDGVKISININENFSDTEIVINSGALTPEIERIIATLRILDQQITVIKNDESYILDVAKIVYIESVDRKTFVYTQDDCFESKLKLYEVEEQLCQGGFLRISKSSLVQLKFIRSLKAELNRKIRLTLENGEQIIVSRQYADELKHRLGVK